MKMAVSANVYRINWWGALALALRLASAAVTCALIFWLVRAL